MKGLSKIMKKMKAKTRSWSGESKERTRSNIQEERRFCRKPGFWTLF
jgi:hypothetical protein